MTDELITIGEAQRDSCRLIMRCAQGRRAGLKSIRECRFRGEINISLMIGAYGKNCSLGSLHARLGQCPWCTSWRTQMVLLRPVVRSVVEPAPPPKRRASYRERERIQPATIAELRKNCPWMWVECARGNCWHRVPMALVPFIIRWGADASGDLIRQRMRCSACGSRGASLMHPSIDGTNTFPPFPTRPEPAYCTMPSGLEE